MIYIVELFKWTNKREKKNLLIRLRIKSCLAKRQKLKLSRADYSRTMLSKDTSLVQISFGL